MSAQEEKEPVNPGGTGKTTTQASSRPQPGRGWLVWRFLLPVVALLAGLLFSISARTSDGTDLRAGRRVELEQLISARAEAAWSKIPPGLFFSDGMARGLARKLISETENLAIAKVLNLFHNHILPDSRNRRLGRDASVFNREQANHRHRAPQTLSTTPES